MEQKFIITPKTEKSVTMTVRIGIEINAIIEKMAVKSGRSRNALINLALQYAFDHIEVKGCASTKG